MLCKSSVGRIVNNFILMSVFLSHRACIANLYRISLNKLVELSNQRSLWYAQINSCFVLLFGFAKKTELNIHLTFSDF